MTAEELKKWIARLPGDAKLEAYEGEANGINCTLGDRYWFISLDNPESSKGFDRELRL